jgi:hypothetical protein
MKESLSAFTAFAFFKKDRKGDFIQSFDQRHWMRIEKEWIPREVELQLEQVPAGVIFKISEDGVLFFD